MASTPPTATTIMGHVKWTPKLCGNTVDGGKQNCSNQPTKLCTGCKLVAYCSKECQKGHWRVHNDDCKAPLRTEAFLPNFCYEARVPVDYIFPGAEQLNTPHLWSTSPAMDVLNLQSNEGERFNGNLFVLFADCNDLRDVMKTVNSLPANYRGVLSCDINHGTPAVAARNLLTLLVAIKQPPALAAEIIVHLWYSALLTRSMFDAMKTSILPHLNVVINTITENTSETQRSTNEFGIDWTDLAGVNCRISFCVRESFLTMLQQLLTVEHDKATAMENRARMVLHPRFTDAMQFRSYNQQCQWRSSAERYRFDGVLSPFGACIDAFDVVNPTMFAGPNSSYQQSVFAAPLDGWRIQELMAFPSGGPSQDLLGQLYFFLRAEVEKFCVRITQGPRINLHVTCCEARKPHFAVPPQRCDRIHISKSAMQPEYHAGPSLPRCWGLQTMLENYSPLLKPRSANKHATIIAVFEQFHERERQAPLTKREREGIVPKLREYGYVKPPSLETPEGKAFKHQVYFAGLMLAPFDELFDDYVTRHNFRSVAQIRGMKMKNHNTIVDKWPARFTKAPGEEGAEEAFRQKLGENAQYEERVAEFTRLRL